MMEPVSRKVGNQRLLQLASMLEAVEQVKRLDNGNLQGYDQAEILHPCGSPACAWGHWYVANRERINQEALGVVATTKLKDGSEVTWVGIEQAEREFSMDAYSRHAMFGANGCHRAVTGADAAKYIRSFVVERTQGERS